MWSHYADFHRGICLEFNFADDRSIAEIPGRYERHIIYPFPVKYRSERPIINIIQPSKAISEFMQVKSTEWAYEEEHRAFTTDYIGIAHYEPWSLRKIIIGCQMSDSKISDLLATIKMMKYQPKVEQARMKEHTFGLDIVSYPT
jgi:hypothetical protein